MTEAGRHATERGRHPRWSVAALLAPASAAVFAGTVGRTADHQQVTSASASSSQKSGEHQKSGDHQPSSADGEALERQVAALRTQVAHLTRGRTSSKPSTRPTRPSAPAASSARAPKRTRKQTAAPAPALAPATQTTTGGS